MISDYEVLKAMRCFGGSFIRALAEAISTADEINRQKLKDAFPEYWAQYAELARLESERRQRAAK